MWYQGAILCNALDAASDVARPLACGLAAIASLALVALARRTPGHLAPKRCTAISAALGIATFPLVLWGAEPALVIACIGLCLGTVWSLALSIVSIAADADTDANARVNASADEDAGSDANANAGSVQSQSCAQSQDSREASWRLGKLVICCAAMAALLCAVCALFLQLSGAQQEAQLATSPLGLIPALLAAVAPFCVGALAGRTALPELAKINAGPAPADAELTYPESFLPFSNRLFIALMLLGCAAGSGYSVIARTGLSLCMFQFAAAAVLCVGFALPALLRRKQISATGVYWVVIACAFTGMLLGLLWPYTQPVVGSVSLGLQVISTQLFYLVLVWLIAAMSVRNPLSSVSLSAFAIFAFELGLCIDGLFWLIATALMGSRDVPSNVVMLVFFVIFMLYNLLFVHGYDFDGVVMSLRPVKPVRLVAENADAPQLDPADDRTSIAASKPTKDDATPAQRPSPEADTEGAGEGVDSEGSSIDERSGRVAVAYGLTSRETDVLRLLARGYSGLAIQNKLVVSRNTVKTHVRNIYAKLDVHSQQELIDLVEAA